MAWKLYHPLHTKYKSRIFDSVSKVFLHFYHFSIEFPMLKHFDTSSQNASIYHLYNLLMEWDEYFDKLHLKLKLYFPHFRFTSHAHIAKRMGWILSCRCHVVEFLSNRNTINFTVGLFTHCWAIQLSALELVWELVGSQNFSSLAPNPALELWLSWSQISSCCSAALAP